MPFDKYLIYKDFDVASYIGSWFCKFFQQNFKGKFYS